MYRTFFMRIFFRITFLYLLCFFCSALYSEHQDATQKSSCGLNITAGALVETVYQPSLNLSLPTQGNGLKLTMPYSLGFNIQGTLKLDHDLWTGSLNYDWFRSEQCVEGANQFISTWNIGGNAPDIVDQIKSNTVIEHKFLRLAVARALSEELSYHFGFAADWQHQDFELEYNPVNLALEMQQKFDAWGAGLRTGFLTTLPLLSKFAITFQPAISLLWTRFRIKRRDTNPQALLISVDENSYTVRFILDQWLALSWISKSYSINLGWQQIILWNNNRFILLQENAPLGNTSIQGLKATLSYSF